MEAICFRNAINGKIAKIRNGALIMETIVVEMSLLPHTVLEHGTDGILVLLLAIWVNNFRKLGYLNQSKQWVRLKKSLMAMECHDDLRYPQSYGC